MKSMLYLLLAVAVILGAWFVLKPADTSTKLNPAEFKEKYEETPGVVIDVRSKGEHQSGHIAITDHNFNVMDGELESKLDSLSKDSTYYLYCRSGNRSGRALKLMKDKGFEKVYNVGGYNTLVNNGFDSQ